MKTHATKNPAVTANGLELPIMLAPLGAVSCLSGRAKALGTTVIILGLLVYAGGAPSQAAALGGHAQFEPASVFAPAGSDCVLHPKDNPDPSQSIALRSDADGVVRFLAVRPALPASVDQLTLDCTDSLGNANTYSVDLRSEDTFVRRPFDPSLANLVLRPGLTGDPLSLTQDQLVEAGYGLRPDPTADPEGYNTWLAAVSVPAYKLKAAPRASSAPSSSHQLAAAHVSADSTPFLEPEPESNSVFLFPQNYWTGAELTGSYKKSATSAKTYGYVENTATFVVPSITPNIFAAKTAVATIWNGLDNVFQAIVDVAATSTAAGYSIHRQNFYHDLPTVSIDEQGVDFTPNSGDKILVQEWYCDSKGHVKMAGGYGCSIMIDQTQNIEWECTQSNSSICQSYPIESQYLTNGALGQTAEFVIEDDTAETDGNCPKATAKTNCYDEWIDISPVTMTGSALVVKGASQTGKSVTTSTDPNVFLLTDDTASIPFEFGDRHFLITLPSGAVKWSGLASNIYYWDGIISTTLTPQKSTTARPGVIFGCASWIAVAPNSRGLTNGTPWTTGCQRSGRRKLQRVPDANRRRLGRDAERHRNPARGIAGGSIYGHSTRRATSSTGTEVNLSPTPQVAAPRQLV